MAILEVHGVQRTRVASPEPEPARVREEMVEEVFGHLRTQSPSKDSGYADFEEGCVRELLADRDYWRSRARGGLLAVAGLAAGAVGVGLGFLVWLALS